MRRKAHEQTLARELRAKGWSLRSIAAELGVSLSSTCVWTAGIAVAAEPKSPNAPEVHDIDEGEPLVCRSCRRLLHRGAFTKSGAAERRCRECLRKYFQQRGELHRSQSAAAKRRRKKRAAEFISGVLSSARCADCQLADPLVLEFDHVGPKRAHMNTLVNEGYSVTTLSEELANCEIVCVNCHRRRTDGRRGGWRLDPDRLDVTGPRRRRNRNLLLVLAVLLGSSCADCGEKDLVVLEFDHVGPKRDSVVNLACQEYSVRALRQEIAQCEVRCANCHRRRTMRAGGGYRSFLSPPP